MSTQPSPSDESTEQPLRPRQGVLFRRLGDGGVIVDLNGDHIFELNDTGARIWEHLEEGRSLATIPAALVAEFAVDSDTAAADLRRLLDELRRAGLLER